MSLRRGALRYGRRQGPGAGADVVAMARPLLAPAIESTDAVVEVLGGFIEELRGSALHCCGAADLAALRRIGVNG